MSAAAISPIESAIVVGYFIVIIVMGFVLSRRISTGSDFFLAGNRLGWAAIGFSLFASNISSST
ncbi:MAG: hypothetical protein KTR24_08465, partial [Saprospiraceae bacterium]|nr:hypothetical protein [Saprospiraceae bacterium]